MQVEGIQVHANEGGLTQTRGGAYWLILPAGCNSLILLLFYSLISNMIISGSCFKIECACIHPLIQHVTTYQNFNLQLWELGSVIIYAFP